VKGPVMVAIGLLGDLLERRRVPVAAIATAVAAVLGELTAAVLKEVFDRARPAVADSDWKALIATPSSESFPSGHASTAFAAAMAITVLAPRLRMPALVLAALVAASRVVLGVHYPSDVLVGALVGAAVGTAVALVTRRLLPPGRASREASSPPATSTARDGPGTSRRARGAASP